MELDPQLLIKMEEKTNEIYSAYAEAEQAMRKASRAIEELHSMLPVEMCLLLPDPPTIQNFLVSRQDEHFNGVKTYATSYDSNTNSSHNYSIKMEIDGVDPVVDSSAESSSGDDSGSNYSPAGVVPRRPRTPIKKVSRKRGPRAQHTPEQMPVFNEEQNHLLDRFQKYFNLRMATGDTPQWKIGVEIAQMANNEISLDSGTVSRMARRLRVPRNPRVVDAIWRWINSEAEKQGDERVEWMYSQLTS